MKIHLSLSLLLFLFLYLNVSVTLPFKLIFKKQSSSSSHQISMLLHTSTSHPCSYPVQNLRPIFSFLWSLHPISIASQCFSLHPYFHHFSWDHYWSLYGTPRLQSVFLCRNENYISEMHIPTYPPLLLVKGLWWDPNILRTMQTWGLQDSPSSPHLLPLIFPGT